MRSLSILVTLLAPIATVTSGFEPTSAAAEPVPTEAQARVDSGRLHLWGSMIWGGLNVAGGTALTLASEKEEHPTRWAFGVQSALWGGINVGIAGVGLLILRGPASGRSRAELIDKERLYHDALVFSMGLDIAYMTAGATMLVASYRGVDNAAEWRGHGAAVIVQGAALFAFEGLAWLGSRKRLGRLVAIPTPIATATGSGFGLSLSGAF